MGTPWVTQILMSSETLLPKKAQTKMHFALGDAGTFHFVSFLQSPDPQSQSERQGWNPRLTGLKL